MTAVFALVPISNAPILSSSDSSAPITSIACALLARAEQTVAPADLIEVHRRTIPDSVRQYHRTLVEGRPPLRGFRAPILQGLDGSAAHDPWPLESTDPELAEAVDRVEKRLARDGLLATTAQVMEILGPAKTDLANGLGVLRNTGLPVDWLGFFHSPAGGGPIVDHIARRLSSGASSQDLRDELARIPPWFTQSRAGFALATECGDYDIGALRLQITSGSYWAGAGDGGCLDMVRQLVEALPEVSFTASLEEKHVDAFLAGAAGWPLMRAGRFTLVPEPFPVAQWAQDNGKPGFAASSDGRSREIVTLVPRYASRGEDGSVFVPGETYALDGFASAGHAVVQSPLLFQGGNLMAVRDPKSGQRTLLIGEAEIYRNTALGLTRDQVIDALRIELGVDRVVVLPAASFHIDFELCVRARENDIVAFVNDTTAAARIVLASGVDALEAHQDLDGPSAASARELLKAERWGDFMALVSPVLLRKAPEFGRFPESFSKAFSRSASDSGVGNLQRFMLAMDLVTSQSVGDVKELGMDPDAAAYLHSFARRDADRRVLVKAIEDLGWKVVPVPSLSEGDRGINYLNGISERNRYLMPAYGGLFRDLDEAASKAFSQALGPRVQVLPILTAETQRRAGALHCSVSVLPSL